MNLHDANLASRSPRVPDEVQREAMRRKPGPSKTMDPDQQCTTPVWTMLRIARARCTASGKRKPKQKQRPAEAGLKFQFVLTVPDQAVLL
ncbi:hypothetical protein [Bradyrhizobium vignae]|uniref:hypothetical protein n=1 Tax=Bradyrhizobium vignae TaxID=1549949 RepID=UPI00100A6A53|nr:hypothetical protein [Bradyrhizobium vignae]RXH03781.1 hypothetical protein EAV90_13250 [Bradyrhizobium vignae]